VYPFAPLSDANGDIPERAARYRKSVIGSKASAALAGQRLARELLIIAIS